MKMRARFIFTLVLVVFCQGYNAIADFVISGNDQVTINDTHNRGLLFEYSHATIGPNGSVGDLLLYDFSKSDVMGGMIKYLISEDQSEVRIYEGEITGLSPNEGCEVEVFNGKIYDLKTYGDSFTQISGGSVIQLSAYNDSDVTFVGQNFNLSGDLVLDGNRVLGRGTLEGEWLDGTVWSTFIASNHPTATVLIVPEPATLLLLGFGTLILRKRK